MVGSLKRLVIQEVEFVHLQLGPSASLVFCLYNFQIYANFVYGEIKYKLCASSTGKPPRSKLVVVSR